MSNTVNNYTETDLGNISLNPRGEYDDSAAYEYLDTVSYRGGSYFCLAELETTITGIAPDAGRNSEYWQMIAAPGDMTPEYTAAHNDVIKKSRTGRNIQSSSRAGTAGNRSSPDRCTTVTFRYSPGGSGSGK